MKKNGLDDLEDPANKIFNYATQKYTMDNPNDFAQKMIKLEMQHQKIMESLMRDPHGAQEGIDYLGSHLRKTPAYIIFILMIIRPLSSSEILSNRIGANKITEDTQDLSSSLPPQNLGK